MAHDHSYVRVATPPPPVKSGHSSNSSSPSSSSTSSCSSSPSHSATPTSNLANATQAQDVPTGRNPSASPSPDSPLGGITDPLNSELPEMKRNSPGDNSRGAETEKMASIVLPAGKEAAGKSKEKEAAIRSREMRKCVLCSLEGDVSDKVRGQGFVGWSGGRVLWAGQGAGFCGLVRGQGFVGWSGGRVLWAGQGAGFLWAGQGFCLQTSAVADGMWY